MVFLKKLELAGFKTFAKRTTVTFDRGLNVIIGPNGSGKSNLVDALQFVLGELSARTLRAPNFSSLLFHGSQEAEKANHAVVSLTLDNSDRRLPIDTELVAISRYISHDGNSTYRINGKRASRQNLLDVLGVAALTTGLNFVFQGTTMRIADYSPEERRKSIEGLIGIAEYDKKKEEAQVELREADTNLKVATGRFEEVKNRLLELERERHDLLRYDYMKTELNRLKAERLSHDVLAQQKELDSLTAEIESKNAQYLDFKSKRSQLEDERQQKEREWRQFSERVIDKGNDELIILQQKIGDTNSRVMGIKTRLLGARTSVQSYENMRRQKEETLSSIREQIIVSQKQLKKLRQARQTTEEKLSEKRKLRAQLLERLNEIKASADSHASKVSQLEDEVNSLEIELGRLEIRLKGERESLDILIEQLRTQEERRKQFETLQSTWHTKLKLIVALKNKEQKRLDEMLQIIERTRQQKEMNELEVKNAALRAKQARLYVKEFESKKELAESALSEDKALEHLETLSQLGVLQGIHGRLIDRIKIVPSYRRAVEAAAEGWLRALVVDDMDAVRRCAESLRRGKIGRVKLLPVSNVQGIKQLEKPGVAGVIGSAASFVESNPKYKPAVNFVFGDTLVASNEESALRASDQGYRVVTIDGEVYEPGFRLEVGFYREPIDLADVIPSDNTIKKFSETVNSFEQVVEKRAQDLKRLSEDLIKYEADKQVQIDNIRYFELEISNLERDADRIHKDIVELNRKIRSGRNRLENLQTSITAGESRRAQIESRLHELRTEVANLRKRFKPENITKIDSEKAALDSEIVDMENSLNSTTSQIMTLESNVKNVYVPSFETARGEFSNVNRNISAFKRDAESAQRELDEATKIQKELEKSRDQLSSSMLVKKEEARRFSGVLADIDKQLQRINKEFDPLNEELVKLREVAAKVQTELGHMLEELRTLGYSEPTAITTSDLAILGASIDRLEAEFVSLSRTVNMNALSLYESQRQNYQQLSEKINQLEAEKREILSFMESIEAEKKQAFLSALAKVNQKFSDSFAKIVQGRGWLQLQNPEDPFSGGVDIVVEFPGKAQMLITGASGGEKSVVAVCYIFAIKTLSQTAPFYVLDEVDAHMDPVNVQRLADLLEQESQNAQIVAITFKEAVAAKSKRIFGVYGKNGISYLTSMPQAVIGVTA